MFRARIRDPTECIDCTLCVEECPAQAILHEDELPANEARFLPLNAELAREWPVIARKIPAPADAAEWDGKADKLVLLER